MYVGCQMCLLPLPFPSWRSNKFLFSRSESMFSRALVEYMFELPWMSSAYKCTLFAATSHRAAWTTNSFGESEDCFDRGVLKIEAMNPQDWSSDQLPLSCVDHTDCSYNFVWGERFLFLKFPLISAATDYPSVVSGHCEIKTLTAFQTFQKYTGICISLVSVCRMIAVRILISWQDDNRLKTHFVAA